MKEKQKLKNARGITLVALVVTIIVLIILAGVSINMVLGQNGIITQAKEAKEKTLNAEAHEQEQMNEVVDYIKNNGTSSGNNNTSKELISKETSYVGYYADINGDGTVDGVIYADLAIGGSGEWGSNGFGTFSYEATAGTKDYYVSQTNYEGSFGTKDVLTATGSGKDRFYVMALTNVSSTKTKDDFFAWYGGIDDKGISDYSTITSTGFGSGKTNTETMVEKWDKNTYGTQNANETYIDVWGAIQKEISEGWFVPSKDEWSAFAYNLGTTTSNSNDLGLKYCYWSSSLSSSNTVYIANYFVGYISDVGAVGNNFWYIRLATTF